ncbi:MAG: adenylyl-sulfate kinase [Proteobacteria bacterium]|nr:adenylyl-sulfate kinase [Pseudomonadota bacterium]
MALKAKQKIQDVNTSLAKDKVDCLQIVTCGSVDSGKSTLMGRLLFDSQLVYDDQLDALQKDTKKYSSLSGEENMDFSLLLDGLKDEREQGITIDLAYRFFQISGRRFIIADAPGHEQYTKNMAAGASNSSLGIIVVDSEKGILPQTRRHTYILYLMGVRHFVLCVNKMDLVNYSETVFKKICADYEQIIQSFKQHTHKIVLRGIPLSAAKGDNVVYKSSAMDWYKGDSVLSYLKSVNADTTMKHDDFMMQVQLVSKPQSTVRCYMGTVSEGKISVGEKVKILPGGQESRIKEIIKFDAQNIQHALQGDATALTLEDDIDIVRGDLIISENNPLKMADHFRVNLLCIDEAQLYSSRSYLFKFNHKILTGTLADIKEKYKLDSLYRSKNNALNLNEFGSCDIFLNQKIPFKLYEDNKTFGSFLVIDRISKKTIGVGMILFDLARSHTIIRSELSVSKKLRSQIKAQKPCVLWFTGLSGSGKTTLANLVEGKLFDKGYHTYLIDGDNLRKELSADLGFTMGDRIENMRRIGYLSKYFVEAGLITLVSTISPFRNERENNRELFEPDEFIEIYVNASLETCIKRDPKAIYSKHKLGNIPDMTGMESSYEPPLNPEIIVDTENASAETLADKIVNYLLTFQGQK